MIALHFKCSKELNKLFDKIYVSTGATYDQEINFAHKIIDNQKIKFFALCYNLPYSKKPTSSIKN